MWRDMCTILSAFVRYMGTELTNSASAATNYPARKVTV
jgi:hypothetical protein